MFKYFAIHIIRVVLYVFYIFPINKKKIFFSSYEGGQFSCNPKYIFRDVYSKLPGLQYVWCLNYNSSELAEYKNILIVRRETLLWIYHILTSKVIITNRHLRGFLPYRKNQSIINTWHGGGAYKRIGFADNSDISRKYWLNKGKTDFFALSIPNITWIISSCKRFSDVMYESCFISNNKFLPIGMPRNDIFFNDNKDLIISIKNKLNIPIDYGVVLYAPTYRGSDHSLEFKSVMDLDIKRIKIILKEKFHKTFVCLYRGHYLFQKELQRDDAIDISSYNDMQELLLITDILITDYSSSIWDFSLTKKPCFLFTPDLDLYLSRDRGFYTPIEQWPYHFARTNEELCNNIMNFDQAENEAKIKKHHEDLGSYEQGTATSKVTELLQKIFE
jgi:CDP-glycerol glycerophosphotransferase